MHSNSSLLKSYRPAVFSLIDIFARDKNKHLSRKDVLLLTDQLLPLLSLSLYIPSSHEILLLAKALVSAQDMPQIEKLLRDSTAETRKALYVLCKITPLLGALASSNSNTPGFLDILTETSLVNLARNASIGIYMGWFREIFDGSEDASKMGMEVGLFEICHEVYRAGEAYKYLSQRIYDSTETDHTAFYTVLQRHLDSYRNRIYTTQIDQQDLYSFYVEHSGGMKWLYRLCHVAQELLAVENVTLENATRSKNAGGYQSIIEFTDRIAKSPWTTEFAQEVLEEYKKPLSDRLVKWMQGHPAVNTFIIDQTPSNTIEHWNMVCIQEKEIPKNISSQMAKQILYIGRAKRLLSSLKETNINMQKGLSIQQNTSEEKMDSPEIIDTIQQKMEIMVEKDSLLINNISEKDAFDSKWIYELYCNSISIMKHRLFQGYRVYDHLDRIRDVFLLYRNDFSYALYKNIIVSRSYSLEYMTSIVDDALEQCFTLRDQIRDWVDIISGDSEVSLIYKRVFPYSLIVGNIADSLRSAFQLFWNLRVVIHGVIELYHRNKTIATYRLASLVYQLEYYYFERVIGTLWVFFNKALSDDILYSPDKLSKRVENVLVNLIYTCQETCTLSVLFKVQEMLQIQEISLDNVNKIGELLSRMLPAEEDSY